MENTLSLEARIEGRVDARVARERQLEARMEKRFDAAESMIGELNGGRCYVWPAGGKYREGLRHELVDFLIRNNYA